MSLRLERVAGEVRAVLRGPDGREIATTATHINIVGSDDF